jgi:glycosyltransferase involved in cell wall biosynthesis
MQIAQIAPLYESVPPRLYGGTERVVSYLTDALVDLGHDVTLFAAADARTKATLVPVRERSLRLDPQPLKSDLAAHLTMLDEVRRRAGDFDVLHFHIDLMHFPVFESIAGRTLTTLHGRLDMPDLAPFYRRWPQFRLVSISDQQRKPLPFANWAGTVYHGVPQTLFPLTAVPRGGYLAFLGRISPEKRVDRAIAIAQACGIPLKIAAKIDTGDRRCYDEEIAPLIDGSFIEYVGEITEAEKPDFLGNALALLFPIDWPEPFGMVMIEAMGCGTPVIAWDCGSVPEVVEPGVTGHIVTSIEEAVSAVRDIGALDRAKVRHAWEKRFSATAMAKRYLPLLARAGSRDAGSRPMVAVHG